MPTINIDPMPTLRQAAKDRISARYDAQAKPHRDAAYARKKQIAADVLDGKSAPTDFAQEATLRKITAQQLAQIIAGKPDSIGLRELARQQEMAAVDAMSPGQLKKIIGGR
jgi:hypothetical protein